jgi:hypothetical protein
MAAGAILSIARFAESLTPAEPAKVGMTGQGNVPGLSGKIGTDAMFGLTNGTGHSDVRLKRSDDHPRRKLTACRTQFELF